MRKVKETFQVLSLCRSAEPTHQLEIIPKYCRVHNRWDDNTRTHSTTAWNERATHVLEYIKRPKQPPSQTCTRYGINILGRKKSCASVSNGSPHEVLSAGLYSELQPSRKASADAQKYRSRAVRQQ